MATRSTKKTTSKKSTSKKSASNKAAPKKSASASATTKKTAGQRSSQAAAGTDAVASVSPEVAAKAAEVDRSAISGPTRVYTLAKQLGATSKLLLGVLAAHDLKKVAQSSLTPEEVGMVLDDLVGTSSTAAVDEPEKAEPVSKAESVEPIEQAEPVESAEETPAPKEQAKKPAKKATKKTTKKAANKATKKAAKTSTKKTTKKAAEEPAKKPVKEPAPASSAESKEDDEKLRYRVRKNVENEIHQLEDKVEREIAKAMFERIATVAEAATEANAGADAKAATSKDAPAENVHSDEPVSAADSATADSATEALVPVFLSPHEGGEEDSAAEELEPELDEAPVAGDQPDAGQQRRSRSRRRARRTRGNSKASTNRQAKAEASAEDRASADSKAPAEPEHEPEQPEKTDLPTEPVALKGSVRLEAQRRRRAELSEEGRKRAPIVSQAEFLARRESVKRTMVVREKTRHDGLGTMTQVGVLEDDMLVEHFVTNADQASMIGNIYVGRVQNVLSSMEAAFIDIGTGRNGVIYATDLDWRKFGSAGRSRRIDQVLKSGDLILVQVSKDPIAHKGPRLTTQISLAGRYLVYVPGGRSNGISRKLPAPERKRLKDILKRIIPEDGGAIIRTAAENVQEEAIQLDVERLHRHWKEIEAEAEKARNAGQNSKASGPRTIYTEPDTLVKVVRDLFNEDFTSLIIDGERPWNIVHSYISSVAPDLEKRLVRYHRDEHDGMDAFERYRVDEQIVKALKSKVWLPSGGYLIIEQTEAMVVIDVNTGKFTGAGGNLEETVTRNNLEAAEEIVRQMRLRDLGGMIVVDFIDMVLPENRELVLRRLKEALGRDRTRHQVSEVTSLGLVQMTRKRLGSGLLESFATMCECCQGSGFIIHEEPLTGESRSAERKKVEDRHEGRRGSRPANSKDVARRGASREDSVREDAARRDASREDSGHEAETSRGGERRSRRRRRDAELEELAASVLGDEQDERGERDDRGERDSRDDRDHRDEAATRFDADFDRESEEQPRRRSSRRRGRRGGSRGRGSAGTPSTRAEGGHSGDGLRGDDAHLAEDERRDRPRRHEVAPEFAGQLTFEEAVEAFEASPRRKRHTRGNSASDRRPRREDFETPVREDFETPVREVDEPAGSADAAESMAKHGGSRRSRRRAVRLSAAHERAAQAVADKDARRAKAAHRSGEERTAGTAEERRASGAERGRRRRRAVRRTTRRG